MFEIRLRGLSRPDGGAMAAALGERGLEAFRTWDDPESRAASPLVGYGIHTSESFSLAHGRGF